MDGSYPCDYCTEWYFDEEELREHVKKEHPYDYDNWAADVAAGAIGIGLSLLFDGEEEDGDSEGFGLDTLISSDSFDFGGGLFSGGGSDDDW